MVVLVVVVVVVVEALRVIIFAITFEFVLYLEKIVGFDALVSRRYLVKTKLKLEVTSTDQAITIMLK